jgi:hypothetical protein
MVIPEVKAIPCRVELRYAEIDVDVGGTTVQIVIKDGKMTCRDPQTDHSIALWAFDIIQQWIGRPER